MKHSQLIDKAEGSWVTTSTGHKLLAFKPTKAEYIINMPRLATIIYPKDLGTIIIHADVYPGARIVEAGSGSGAITIMLSDLVGPHGHIYSYDVRKDMSLRASENLIGYSPNIKNVTWKIDDITQNIDEHDIDRIILDMPEPWDVLQRAVTSLRPGGILLSFLPTIIQVTDLVNALKQEDHFKSISTVETLERPWKVSGRSVRPSHRMVGHTGFITTARKCLPNT